MRRNMAVLGAVLVSALLSSCGGGGDSAVREVLVDYKHDDFVSSFLAYYPKNVVVHPGDTVRFKQTWTGEPHSVTMGSYIDDMFEFADIFDKYDSEEAARAGGVTDETIDRINATFTHIPGMTDDNGIYQPGARPCFVRVRAEVPAYSDADDNVVHGPTVSPSRSASPAPIPTPARSTRR